MMNTPLLLIIWRRTHTLRQLINAIRPIAPTQLFVACDGPNSDRPGEAEMVAATRALIDLEIDWPCKIEKLYTDVNFGCRLGVSRAITWFFEQVEEGIILEDDCVPHADFFPYCTTLLERYRNDTRVWSICGSNFQLGNQRGDCSYYFSIHGDSWGWATWRRAWKHYTEGEELWLSFRDSGRLDDVFVIPSEREYWRQILDRLFIEGLPSAWDFQWWLSSWMNNALHAWPNSCLVTNIGFDQDGTHTFGESEFASLPLEALGSLRHPEFVIPSRAADEFAFFYRRRGLDWIKQVEEAARESRYGRLLPWVLRKRQLEKEGLIPYFTSRLFRGRLHL